MEFKSYKRLVSVLKKRCPAAYPVSVQRVKLKNLDGYCYLEDKKFYIRIGQHLSESSAIDTLLHEWAHARAWNHLHDSLDWIEFEDRAHDASWGVAYSEVYRVYELFFLDPQPQKENKRCKYNYK